MVNRYIEPAATIASGVIAEPLSGLAGMAGALLPGEPGQGARWVEGTRDAMTYQPRTPEAIRDFLFFKDLRSKTKDIDQAALEGMAIPQAIQRTEQTLAQKAAQGVSDYLFDSGIITDRYRAQEVGNKLSTAAEFLPFFGDASGGDEFGRAVKTGDVAGALMHGAGAVPVFGDAVGKLAIFAGALAKTADLDRMSAAKELANRGVSRDEIWKETGWFEDVDGSWKFEISDLGVEYDKASLPVESHDGRQYRAGKVGDAIAHDDLYGAYPQVSKTGLVDYPWQGDGRGNYRPGFNQLGMKTDPSITMWKDGYIKAPDERVLLHELQHNVQDVEGFAQGGSPKNIGSEIIETMPAYRRWKEQKPIREEIEQIRRSQEYKSDQVGRNELYSSKYETRLDEIDDAFDTASDTEVIDLDKKFNQLMDEYRVEADALFPTVKRVDDLADGLESEPTRNQAYKLLAGEAEARNVETRMDMTPEERRAKPPWQTLDVPENELIVRRGSGQQMSADAIPEGGIDFYSGTMGDPSTSVAPYGTRRAGGNNVFGGIFGSESRETALSHGDNIQKLRSPRHISHDEINSEMFYGDSSSEWLGTVKEVFEDLKGEALDGDELNEVAEYLTGEKSIYSDTPDMGAERLQEIVGQFDDAELDWDLQGLKGEVARRRGYTSAGMADEHGESILGLQGSNIY